jgi:hypothetical protein
MLLPCIRAGATPRPVGAARAGRVVSGVVLTEELRPLGRAFVPGFLQHRWDFGVGDEALPALFVPVEERPDPVALVGIAKDV